MSGNPFIQKLNLDEVHETIHAKKYRSSRFAQPSQLLKSSNQREALLLSSLQKVKRLRNLEMPPEDPGSQSTLLC